MSFENLQLLITVLLLLTASFSFLCGVSYYFRYKHARKLRMYVFLLGIFAGVWCLGYGVLSLCSNLDLCNYIRKISLIGVCGFLAVDFLIVVDFARLNKTISNVLCSLCVSVMAVDWFLYSNLTEPEFEIVGNLTAICGHDVIWDQVHKITIVVFFLIMLLLGIRCLIVANTKREKRFIRFFFISNLVNIFASIPDTFLYNLYGYKLTVSGIGAAVSLMAIWHAAIRMDIFQTNEPITGDEETALKKKYKLQYIITILVTFLGLALLVYMTFGSSYMQTKKDVVDIGKYSVAESAEKINNFFLTTESVLEVTGRASEYLLESNESHQMVLDYLTKETEIYAETINENFTGIYGVFQGEYLDGIGWIPDEGYDPYSRPWYEKAIEANGNVAFTSPYVDAQTGKIMISVCQLMADGESVISMDVWLDSFCEVTEEINYSNSAMGIIVDDEGMVIAKSGTDLISTEDDLQQIVGSIGNSEGEYQIELQGKKFMVFSTVTMENMHLAMIVNEDEYLADIRNSMYRNIALSVLIYLIVLYFCTTSYINRIKALGAAQSKSNFLASMSHEIRTPINAVIGFNEMILRESTENNIREYAMDVDTSIKHLLSIINDILDFSKIESGKVNIIKVKYQVLSLINDINSMIKPRLEEKGLAFKLEIDSNIPSNLLGDEVRIRQIIMNLLTNAVKYTDKGQVTLSFKSVKITDSEDINLVVSVKDTGKGIREEDKSKLFDAFTRVDEKKNRFIEGTGLGLAITNEYIRMMGGTIEVDSTYGEGSEFIVTIPQIVVDAAPIGDISISYAKDHEEKKVHHITFKAEGKRLLVVDDVALNCKVMVRLLKNTGIIIDTAKSGAEALEYDKNNKYDLIFMDHMMPEMDGIECLHKIRESKESMNHDTKVIVLTANAISGMREMYLNEGFDDYLTKPANSAQVEEVLKKYM